MNPVMVDDHKLIKDIYTVTAFALKAGDLEELSRYYMDDSIQFPPDRALLVGWPTIRTSLEQELDGIVFDVTLAVEEIVVSGDCAYAWGHYRADIQGQKGESRAMTSGSFLDIFNRQSKGLWKIACSAWSNYGLGSEGDE